MAAPGATGHGLRTACGSERSHGRRHRAGAGAGVLLAGSRLHRHTASSLISEVGCCGSTPARPPTASHALRFVEGDDGRLRVARGKRRGPGSPSAPIMTAQARSNARERPRGGRYFIYRPPPDGRRSTVYPWGPIRPAPFPTRQPAASPRSPAPPAFLVGDVFRLPR
jgi:hypothetical protein